MSSPIYGISALDFVPASADEAVSLTSFVSDADMAFRSQVARARLDSALSFVIKQYELLKSLTARLVERISQTSTPVTLDSLASVQKNETALRKMFSDDGPNLGATLAEANALYSEIVGSGVTIDAPTRTPVLVERFDDKGKTLSKSFAWMDEAQVAIISRLQSGGISSFPGSQVRETVVKDSQNKVIETTRFTVFSDYANRRPTASALSSTIGSINSLVDRTSEILQAELVAAAKAIDEVAKTSSQAIQFQQESNQSTTQVRETQLALREDFFRRERIIRREREFRALRSDSTSGISNPATNPSPGTGDAYRLPPVDGSDSAAEAAIDRKRSRVKDDF